jgi:hypothetical protein
MNVKTKRMKQLVRDEEGSKVWGLDDSTHDLIPQCNLSLVMELEPSLIHRLSRDDSESVLVVIRSYVLDLMARFNTMVGTRRAFNLHPSLLSTTSLAGS